MPAPAHPSATVILLHDCDDGFEVLLLRRSDRLAFHGGAWVFPGGRVDRADYADADDDPVVAARHAAVRELAEEAGIVIADDVLVPMSRWTTPDFMPKRFETWFFVAETSVVEVSVDGVEMDAHRWVRPQQALDERQAGKLDLPPPTFVTITDLARHRSAHEAVAAVLAAQPTVYTPKICKVDGGACSLYEGDAGWQDADPDRSGPRHRLWISESGWRYERRDG